MSENVDRNGVRRAAAWARWSDPNVAVRLAADPGLDAESRPGCVNGWVEWLDADLIGREPAHVDGVVLSARCDPGVASALAARFPEFPLWDVRSAPTCEARAAFLEAAFSLNRWRARAHVERTVRSFHEAHDLLLRVRGEEGAAELARLARAPAPPLGVYGHRLRKHLARPAGRDDVLRILRLVLTELRPRLAPRERRALRLAVEDFGRGVLPLLAPRGLLLHHARRAADKRLAGQLFLDPYPVELELPPTQRADRTDEPS